MIDSKLEESQSYHIVNKVGNLSSDMENISDFSLLTKKDDSDKEYCDNSENSTKVSDITSEDHHPSATENRNVGTLPEYNEQSHKKYSAFDSGEENELNDLEFPKKKKTKKLLFDSDEERNSDDYNAGHSETEIPSPKKQTLSQSDQEEKTVEKLSRKKKKIKHPVSDDSNSENELDKDLPTSLSQSTERLDDTNVSVTTHSYKSMFQNKDLYDAEGSSDEESNIPRTSDQEYHDQSRQEKNDSKAPKKRSNSQRKSKLSALEEIHSETQRLIRHSRVSLPYHQPKQRTLSEFLSRRKVVPIVPLKTSSVQLSEVWQSIEEREKSAEQFYRSESDSEEEKSEIPSMPEKVSESILQKCESNDLPIPYSKNKDYLPKSSSEGEPQKAVLSESYQNSSEVCENSEQNPTELVPFNISESKTSVVSTDFSVFEGSCPEDSKAAASVNEVDSPESCDNSRHCLEGSSGTLNSETDLKPLNNDSEDFQLRLASEDLRGTEESMFGSEETNSHLFSKTVNEPDENSKKSDMKKKHSNLFNNSLLDIKLDAVPRISGNPNEVIDLETSTEKPAALKLVTRFMKHVSLKTKTKKTEEKVSVAITEVNSNGEVVNLSEEILSIKTTDNSKPGETRFQLKEKLKQKIAQNREEQFVKRIEEYKLNEELTGEGEKSDFEEEAELEFSEPECEPETESEPEENDVDLSKSDYKNKENPFIDEEADESENEGDESELSAEEADHDSDSYSNPPSINVAPLINDGDEGSGVQKNDNIVSNAGDDNSGSGLLALCSGVFPSQAVSLKELEKNEGTEPQSEGLKLFLPEDATMDFCEKKHADNGESSDEEIFTKKPKKKAKLEFSDDEDDNTKLSEIDEKSKLSEEEEEDVSDSDLNEKENEEADDEEVMDEEEEFLHNPSAAAKRFLEDEAELSGSEYGSADEDEVDLDNYEEEQGDQEKINQRKLKAELEKIHMKEIMDEDKREIRILQELLLEDGELHSDGPKRQRQFKWYNQDETDAEGGLFLSCIDDDDDADGSNKKDGAPEEEEDESWRKTRLERENYLQGLENIDDDVKMVPYKSKILKSEKTLLKPSPKVQTNQSPNPRKQFSLISKRGSFLGRGEKLLSKLAEMTNTSSENPLGNSRGKKNMVFAVVSPPKEEEPKEEVVKKRKSSQSLPSAAKKLKFSPGSLNNSRKSIFESLD